MNKGLLDIPKIAKELNERSSVPVIFQVCGDGSALAELRETIERQGLQDVVIAHGRLERGRLLEIYADSHAAIVPTRSNFTEGMPQVCAEAVLSDLPVITSKVANAFDVIGPATVPAETDDFESFGVALLSLIEKPVIYAKTRSACAELSRQPPIARKAFPPRSIVFWLQSSKLPRSMTLINSSTVGQRYE